MHGVIVAYCKCNCRVNRELWIYNVANSTASFPTRLHCVLHCISQAIQDSWCV